MKKIKKKHMKRENEARSWSLEIKIKAFEDKNDSFRRNNKHAVKKIIKKSTWRGKPKHIHGIWR